MPKLETRLITLKLADLKLLNNNARYMTASQFQRLVENVAQDGALTSTPLVYRGEVLSGNHRVQAAIKAGIEEAPCIEILSEITEQHRVALQLSHNSITGQDDLSILQNLYDSLDLDMKGYSGLTDDCFKLDEIDISSLSVGATRYEELTALFLPEEKPLFMDALERVKKHPKTLHLAADYRDFDTVFNTVVKVKEHHNIHNTAVALRVMAELALRQIETEQVQSERTP